MKKAALILASILLVTIPCFGADTIYLLSGDAIVTGADGNKSTVPAFMAEYNMDIGYFRCGTYDGKYIYNVLCLSVDCDKLRKSAYFIGNTETELALEKPDMAKALSDVTYEVDAVDQETGKAVKIQKKVKYTEWEKLGKPKVMKRIDKPIEWQ